jgi:hypothetical protein
MDAKEYNEYLWNIKNKCSGGSKLQSSEKRWSSKHFLLDEIYNCAKIEESKVVSLEWHHNIETWNGYVEYLTSVESKDIKHPGKKMFRHHEYSKILFEGEEDEQD